MIASRAQIKCRHCGLSHRKVELYNIGVAIYGEHARARKREWIRDRQGLEEYLHRVECACFNSEVVKQIQDDLTHMEVRNIASKNMHNKTFCAIAVPPSAHAVRAQLEFMLYTMKSSLWNMPQMLFALLCDSKHVAKSIRQSQEIKRARVPHTSLSYHMKKFRSDGHHERDILSCIIQHATYTVE